MNVKTEVVNYQEFENQAVFEEKLANLILASDADLICLAGFMCILSPIFVDRFKDSILNIHPSLLPLFPGLDTHKKVIASGMAVHGATVHIVTNKLDCGRILGQCVVPVFKSDSQQTLAARLLKQEHELYKQVVRKFIIGEDELLLLS
jgi:phosphoribosylglycinamide formyltransferase-1